MTTVRDQVEMARARGWDLQKTCTELGLPPGRVIEVWLDQDMLALEGMPLDAVEQRKAAS